MTRPTTARAAVILAAISLAGGCSLVNVSNPTLEEGTQLAVTDYGQALPGSRAGYAVMVTFISGGAVQIVAPGTGPADPPRLIRTIRIERHTTTDAQIADDGYLWVATPDDSGGPIAVMYIVDPHTGRIHRSVRLPEEIRAVGNLTVGPDDVYLRSWRDGFSGGIGAIPRACASEARTCDVRLLAELGNVGTPPERALHYSNGALYSFSLGNSRDGRESTSRLNLQTGRVIASLPVSGTSTFDGEHFYMFAFQSPGVLTVVRLDRETLQREAAGTVDVNAFQIAYADGKLYVTDGVVQKVDVYDAASLGRIETIDVSAAGPDGAPEAAVGFLAPGVLMLNHHAYLDTRTKRVVPNAFPLQEAFSLALRHAQGQPYAF